MARSHMLFLKEICGPGERPDFSRTGPEKSNPRSGQQHDEGSVCPDREVLAKRPHTTLSKHVLALSALRTNSHLQHWDHGTECFQHGMWQPHVESTGTQRRRAWCWLPRLRAEWQL